MIPESKQEAVRRALVSAFGAPDVDDITSLTGGLTTALVFRIVVRGEPYLLRLVMPGAPPGGHPARQFACMKIAASAGVAPRMLYASVDDQLLLTDFIERKPYPDDVAVRMATTLRRLHGQDGFPVAINYLEVMDGLVRRFQTARLLPDSVAADFFRGYDEVSSVYPRNRDLVGCHNDLKSDNILFDGTRMWLVDWEAAFVNDRYVDLAWAATFLVHDDATERAYLDAYFDRAVDEYARARYFLMRQLLHVFAASLVLPMAARAGIPIDTDAELPDFHEFHRRWIDRQITLEGMQERHDYGLVHLRQTLSDMRSERFREALEVVARATGS
jgi:aminoglycoside phosphotransferase (APT) family kinase protein